MGLKIGLRLIEGGKSKTTMIISEIRTSAYSTSAYSTRATNIRTNRRLREWWQG